MTFHILLILTNIHSDCLHPAGSLREIVKSYFFQSDLVFTGKVIKQSTPTGFGGVVASTFYVNHIWKGNVSDKIIVSSHTTLSPGYSFVKGNEYIVYSYLVEKDSTFFTSSCSGTKELKGNHNEVDVLNEHGIESSSITNFEDIKYINSKLHRDDLYNIELFLLFNSITDNLDSIVEEIIVNITNDKKVDGPGISGWNTTYYGDIAYKLFIGLFCSDVLSKTDFYHYYSTDTNPSKSSKKLDETSVSNITINSEYDAAIEEAQFRFYLKNHARNELKKKAIKYWLENKT